jgi:hypothetical protein
VWSRQLRRQLRAMADCGCVDGDGIAASTIGRGLRELTEPRELDRVRRAGGGRKRNVAKDATLLSDVGALVEPTSRGDPQTPLLWTCKSVRRLAQELQAQGHQVGRPLVGELLDGMGYSLQGNRKTREGDSHPDRDAQFQHINAAVNAALAEHEPAISVDTKKKELVGDFKNGGREYRPAGDPEKVRVHDFLIKELGRAVPYGVPHGELVRFARRSMCCTLSRRNPSAASPRLRPS